MVAYTFEKRFIRPISNHTKRQTIRKIGLRRHARPGDTLQIYFAMRTKYCRKIIPDPLCTHVQSVTINVAENTPPNIWIEGEKLSSRLDKDQFAIADGFVDLDDMWTFWLRMHGAVRFTGNLIKWQPSQGIGD